MRFGQRQMRASLLLVMIGSVAVCWSVVLPAIGRVPFVRADMERMDAAGIDASALYWTELNDGRLWRRDWDGRPNSKPGASRTLQGDR